MINKTKKLVIVGDGAFAEIAYECFTHDSEYEVIGFAVETAYITKTSLFGLPVVPFEKLEDYWKPEGVDFYAALVYNQLNRLRTRLYKEALARGYKPASYISSRAFVWRNVETGDHCFIFEDNTIQPFVKIGSNVVLWSGNHIGHHSVIKDNCFISSHVVISGFCNIGENTFMGVNSAISNNLTIGEDNWIGPGITISMNTEANMLYKGDEPVPSRVSSRRFFKIK